ncbi:MAG: hypothetical protein KDD38_00240 [Bdellovibrionales bacterium]|nr:hypothetical protein [Bdellovibrionales bacterium]
MNKNIFSTLITFGFVLSLPTSSFARDVDPDQVLTVSQKIEVTQFSQGYANLMNAIAARKSNSVDLRSPEAEALHARLKKCSVIERADGDLIEISGDKCDISYEIFILKRDLGFNESGDPITEVETSEYFVSKSEALTKLVGFKYMKTENLDHSETLISTPSYVKISNGSAVFTNASGQDVTLTTRARLYTNMENEDQTLYRMATIEFEKFAVRFDISAFMNYADVIKSSTAVLNKQDSTLEELAAVFTTYLVGLDI